jgi:hypothetical protein
MYGTRYGGLPLPAFRRVRKEDWEFKTSLSYITRPFCKKTQHNPNQPPTHPTNILM